MKKMIFVICALFTLSNINAIQIQTNETTKKIKSKEIARIKTIGGIIGTVISAYCGFASIVAIRFDLSDDSSKFITIDSIQLALSLIVGLFTFKIAKDGINDLEEIAQEEHTIKR